MSTKHSQRILLTGPPGIGKTTLIKKICRKLEQNNFKLSGFYTEERRDEFNKRSGFDIVTLDGKREKLSRTINHLTPTDSKRYRIGQYFVFPEYFEKLVLPIFAEERNEVLILDEIGKMELLSNKFQTEIIESFKRTNILIVATVPLQRATSIPIVQSLISDPKNKLITVTKANREDLLDEIMSYLT